MPIPILAAVGLGIGVGVAIEAWGIGGYLTLIYQARAKGIKQPDVSKFKFMLRKLQEREKSWTCRKEDCKICKSWHESEVKFGRRTNIVIAGPAGAGKSTLINGLVGDRLAPVSSVGDTTEEITPYEYDSDIVFWDCPGYGAVEEELPSEYTEKHHLLYFDCICVVYDTRFDFRVVKLIEYLVQQGVNVVVIRNKIDEVVYELRKEGYSKEEAPREAARLVNNTFKQKMSQLPEPVDHLVLSARWLYENSPKPQSRSTSRVAPSRNRTTTITQTSSSTTNSSPVISSSSSYRAVSMSTHTVVNTSTSTSTRHSTTTAVSTRTSTTAVSDHDDGAVRRLSTTSSSN